MFLRSLTLKGFKSFADPTTLELEPGLTAVVGPNGSGKSNIVDAVAWVLGAQGPRSVRSTRMDDVIFAGTGRRAALGRAEVTLTIDNTAGPADLHREVGRRPKPRERQADAARRHDALAAELRALRLHLAGRELAALSARQQAAAAARTRLAAEESSIKVELRGLDSSVGAAEAWVASAGGSALGDAVGRVEALRERARGLAAVLAERRRSLGRDRVDAVD